MPNPYERQMIQAAQAQDLQSLLQDIAWTDVLLPKIKSAREQYLNLLVSATLGQPVRFQTGEALSKEQIAGRVHGIDFMVKLIEKVLENGGRAALALKEAGIK